MDAHAVFVSNSVVFTLIIALLFFIIGLWLGWRLWGTGARRGASSAWYAGHPHRETAIAPLMNPQAYSCARFSTASEVTSKAQEPANEAKKPEAAVTKTVEESPVATSASADMPAAWASLGDDVSSGKARLDESLGLVYSDAPEHADDLTALKGVAKVLNGKLNNFGVYTYRQIAGWDDAIIAEFSTRLSFKDRVKRDDWTGQAKALHKEKYGEDLD